MTEQERMEHCRQFIAKGDHKQATYARLQEYNWIARAETHDLTEHF